MHTADQTATALPEHVERAIWHAPRGTYQESLLEGRETWSGSSLRGKAREYAGKYAASRAALLAEINRRLPDGWTAATEILDRRRVLVVTSPDGQRFTW